MPKHLDMYNGVTHFLIASLPAGEKSTIVDLLLNIREFHSPISLKFAECIWLYTEKVTGWYSLKFHWSADHHSFCGNKYYISEKYVYPIS